MTIELALSGLTMALFCTIAVFLFVGLSIIAAAAMILGFIKLLSIILLKMEGGINELG